MRFRAWLVFAACRGVALSAAPTAWAQAATLDAPPTAAAGSSVTVKWTGPAGRHDRIIVVPPATPDGQAKNGTYITSGLDAHLRMPEQPGEYELRYFPYKQRTPLARRRISVLPVSATVAGPSSAVAGSSIQVEWTGPHNRIDRIGVVQAGSPDRTPLLTHTFVSRKSPLSVRAPEQPGEYEIRYVTAYSRSTLASTKITITAASASIEGPIKAVAGAEFTVRWQGPANSGDRVLVIAKGASDVAWERWGYVYAGKALVLRAPHAPGSYELRYVTGHFHTTLARAALEVTPAEQVPGLVEVSVKQAVSQGGAVEVILDASGSMLQRIGSQRRIDVAVQTLTELTTSTIPGGTAFALRVFGREANSCQSDLVLPLRPLDGAAIKAAVSALEPKNNAKTPIGASLEAVEQDLGAVKGERLVILITDGEETCGGDPASAIEELKRAGVDARVNIVGFAIEEAKLASTFRLWATAGGGDYFDARDAAGLSNALGLALRPAFEIVDKKKSVVATGVAGAEPVKVMPGEYRVKLAGKNGPTQPVRVRSKETSTVRF
jgi:hypothetical protein